MEVFPDLLPEILEYIFSFCTTADMVNFACSCTEFQNTVRHLLFRHVKIRWSSLLDSSMLSKKLGNFKFSSCLVFSENSLGIQPLWWNDVSYNYFNILKHCDPNKLTTLHLSEINNNVLVHTLELCGNLQDLELSYYYSRSNTLHDLREHLASDVSSSCWKKLSTVSSLRRLSIFSCTLTDNDIANISKHRLLQELVINHCACLTKYSIQTICGMVQLKRLSYNGNTSGFDNIVKLQNLTDLNISDTSIENDALIEICSSPLKLKSLALHSCYKLNDIALFSVSMQLSLEKLDVSKVIVTDIVLHHISTLVLLTELNLGSCDLVTDEGIHLLDTLTKLHRIDISYCFLLTDNSLMYLSTLPMKYLCITACKISDGGMLHISRMYQLKELDIMRCVNISENGLNNITLLRLNELKLSRTRFSNATLDRFCVSTRMVKDRLSCEKRAVHLTFKR